MKKCYLFFLFLLSIANLNAQNDNRVGGNDVWGDYYFINGQYQKAIAAYAYFSGDLSLAQQRNFAQAYARVGAYTKAKKHLYTCR